MKRKVLMFACMFMLLMNITVFAAGDAKVSCEIKGDFKKGENVTLYVNVNNVDRLYSASVDFIYNPEFIKVNSIEGGEFIKASGYNPLELGGETDKDGNRASYQFTYTGQVDGVKGTGDLVKINLDVLQDGKLVINDKNLKVKLIQISNEYEVDYMDFKQDSLTIGKGDSINLPGEDNTEEVKPEQNDNSDNNNSTNEENKENTDSQKDEGESKEETELTKEEASKEDNKEEVKTEDNINEENENIKNTKNNKLGAIIIVTLISVVSCAFIYYKKKLQ